MTWAVNTAVRMTQRGAEARGHAAQSVGRIIGWDDGAAFGNVKWTSGPLANNTTWVHHECIEEAESED